jgi:hypothetical protein
LRRLDATDTVTADHVVAKGAVRLAREITEFTSTRERIGARV